MAKDSGTSRPMNAGTFKGGKGALKATKGPGKVKMPKMPRMGKSSCCGANKPVVKVVTFLDQASHTIKKKLVVVK